MDRTIGIDLVACIFGEDDSPADDRDSMRQEITFWDTLLDRRSITSRTPRSSRVEPCTCCCGAGGVLDATPASPNQAIERSRSGNESFHYVPYVALARHDHLPAQFVFIGTKADIVEDRRAIKVVCEDLQDRFEAWMEARRLRHSNGQLKVEETGKTTSRTFNWLVVNTQFTDSITAACHTLQRTIMARDIGFPMGTTYSHVIRYVKARREDAQSAENGVQRIELSIIRLTTLRRQLVRDIEDLERSDCEQILRTLNDLGDILWYDHIDVGVLKDFIIVDPMLVLDAIREVIRHDFSKQIGAEWPEDGTRG